MKKLIGLVFITVLTGVSLFAQTEQAGNPTGRAQRTPGTPRQQSQQREQREPVTVKGTLKLENGFIAVQSGENTFVVPRLNFYMSFINGLKEGASVSIEGITFANSRRENQILHMQKLTIDGRDYNFPQAMTAQRNMPQFRQMPRYAPNSRGPQPKFNAPRRVPYNMRDRGNAPGRSGEHRRTDRPNREERTRKPAPAAGN